jgi:3-ketosteroid 9alpha-monooxygenase subunit B
MSYNQLRIARIVQETPDARSFVLEIPAELAGKYRYRAGQFLTFRVPHPEGAFNRCYSLSSAPDIDGLPKVTVKRVDGGKGSNWFHDALKEGGTLEVLPPAGRFVLGEGDAPLLLFGGGSGITPMMSLIKSALKAGNRRIRLFYANRDKPSIIFDGELMALLAEHQGRLEVIHHLDAEQGLTQPQEIAAALKGFENAEAYLCGPGPFMTLVENTLLGAGMAREKVRIERFEASGNDAVPRGGACRRAQPAVVVRGGFLRLVRGQAHQGQDRAGQERHLHARRSSQQLDPDLPGPLFWPRGRDHLRRGVDHLTLRSTAQRCVSKGGKQSCRCPPFETGASRPPQGEVVCAHIGGTSPSLP